MIEACSSSAPFVGSDFSEDAFHQMRRILLQRCQFDIATYKDSCIKRRIAKRVRTVGLRDIPSYLRRLAEDPAECDLLLAALSIHVSQFFRNPSTFAALKEKILPGQLRRAREEGRQFLVWSAGCAGGEEPYSLALLLDELGFGQRAAIMASDISNDVLMRAREGFYEVLRLGEVPVAVRDRYFTREGSGYRLAAGIRRRVRFERQDVLAAEPYPPADLILCRNVLIYFTRDEQEKILCRFAAALRPKGVLVLGKAETLVGKARGVFRSEEPGERIYRREELPADFSCS